MSQHSVYIAVTADDDRALGVDVARNEVQDARDCTAKHACGGGSASLFYDHCHGEAFVKNAQLAIALQNNHIISLHKHEVRYTSIEIYDNFKNAT